MQRTDSFERPWCWKRLKWGGEGNDRGWDGWMPSLTWWAWVWASSGHWWRTEKPGILQSMGSERVRHAWVTELNWKEFSVSCWLWKSLLCKTLLKCLKKCSHLARGQVNMADEAKHRSPIRSSWSVGCALWGWVLSRRRVGPFLLTSAGCRHCNFQCIPSICRAYFSNKMVLLRFGKLFWIRWSSDHQQWPWTFW